MVKIPIWSFGFLVCKLMLALRCKYLGSGLGFTIGNIERACVLVKIVGCRSRVY